MTFFTIALVAGGLLLLGLGGEVLIRGASRLAAAFGISPLVVGLTVVSVGTSAPELAVSLNASIEGNAAIAVGNVAGSNIFNVLFILGLCALISPLSVRLQLVRLDVPVMAGVSLALTAFAWNGELARWEGALLLLGCVLYTATLIQLSRKEPKIVREEFAQEFGPERVTGQKAVLAGARNLAFVVAGIALLVLGADWLVEGAVSMARGLGVSEAVIGLTIVAVGTSLPEVVTSVVATLKNERDIAVGNVVGSSIYNVLLILGVSGVVSSGGVAVEPKLARFDLPVAAGVALACIPVFFTGMRVSRAEGALFLGSYAAYTAYLIATA